MKKFIAVALAFVSLLFCFVPAVSVADANTGIEVCEDIEPEPNPWP